MGYEQNTQIGGVEISVKENLTCCGENACCDYSISCCGADCGVSSSDCVNAVASVGEGCIIGCASCAGDAISSLGSFLCFVLEFAGGVLDS